MKYMRGPLSKRFWNKVDVRATNECWLWQGSKNADGYGLITTSTGHTKRTHQVSFMLAHGSYLSPPMCVLHTCDNPPCVNPAHLYAGTQKDNASDREARNVVWRERRRLLNIGSKNAGAKITESIVPIIRDLWDRGWPRDTLGAFFKLGPKTIWKIGTRRAWQHVN